MKTQWATLLKEEETRFAAVPVEVRDALVERLAWMREVDMAVVVSQGQNEIADLKAKQLDMGHRLAGMTFACYGRAGSRRLLPGALARLKYPRPL